MSKDLDLDEASNPDLARMHRDLVALVRRLEESMDAAPDAQAIGALSDQIIEINSRVTATGRVLLARQTEQIAIHAAAVTAAIPSIERELEDLERVQRVVAGVTSLLATVDETIRVATLVCG